MQRKKTTDTRAIANALTGLGATVQRAGNALWVEYEGRGYLLTPGKATGKARKTGARRFGKKATPPQAEAVAH